MSTAQNADVVVVTVCYRSKGALDQWYACRTEGGIEVVFVDNASKEDLRPIAQRLGARIVASPRNVGFGRGCNLGAETAGPGTEWIAFVNPDVTVENDQLRELIEGAPAHAVAICPDIVDAHGERLGDVRRSSPSAMDTIRLWLLGTRGQSRSDRMMGRAWDQTARHIEVQVTSGACLLVRRSAFNAVGGFPSWLFFNGEDVYLCDRLRRYGPLYVDTQVRVRHEKLSSANVIPMPALLAETARSASAYAADKFPGPSWAVTAAAIIGGFALRSLVRSGYREYLWPLANTIWLEGRAIRADRLEDVGPRFIEGRD